VEISGRLWQGAVGLPGARLHPRLPRGQRGVARLRLGAEPAAHARYRRWPTEASAIWTEICLCGVCSCHEMVRASQPRCGSAEILLRFEELSGWRARLAAGDVVFFTAATVVVQVLRPRLRTLITS
jgi:hypothetical protein